VEVEVGGASSADDKVGSKVPAASVVSDGVVSWVVVAVGGDVALASAAIACVGVAAEDTAGERPADPKLLDAVVEAPLATSTLLTTTTSPSTLVTFTSTVVVPKPLEYWKKLYGCLAVPTQVDPPLVLTSRLVTALLALTTCMLNQ
jgi:hypothetical protein